MGGAVNGCSNHALAPPETVRTPQKPLEPRLHLHGSCEDRVS
jgi:hypothetical protein